MSEFEEFVRSQGFSGDFQRGCNGQYKSDLLHFMEKAFMHQQAEIDRLSSVLDERTKEWLQAIECGTYFENVAKPLKEENDSLRVQLSLQRDRNKALEVELTNSRNYSDDLHEQLNNMETCYIEKKKEVEELQGQVGEALEEIQRALNCCESTETACVLGELVKVLRGAND